MNNNDITQNIWLLWKLFLPLFICVSIGLPFLIKKHARNRIDFWEYPVAILPVLVWNYLIMIKFGTADIGALLEVYAITFVVVLFCILRYFCYKFMKRFSGTFVLLLLALPFILRLVMPLIIGPELE